MKNKFLSTSGTRSLIFVRLMTGMVFLSEGIQKFLFADALGAGRFLKIGIPIPEFFAPFVGIIEIVAGILLIFGLFTRIAALLLLIDISVAILTTKIPMLAHSFWAFAHEARTDFCMFLGTFALLFYGGGKWSVDMRLTKNNNVNKATN